MQVMQQSTWKRRVMRLFPACSHLHKLKPSPTTSIEIFETQPPDLRNDRPVEAQAMFRYAMLNRSALCQETIAHRGILDVIEPLLGEDCHVIANTAWRNPPNSEGMHGGEAWHIDAGPHIPLAQGVKWPAEIPHPTFAIGVHIYLRQCTINDGPTGVLPGSHLSGQFPPHRPPNGQRFNVRWAVGSTPTGTAW